MAQAPWRATPAFAGRPSTIDERCASPHRLKAGGDASVTLQLERAGQLDKHGKPKSGLKQTFRVIEKAALRRDANRSNTRYVCDVVRAMLVAPSMSAIAHIIDAISALSIAGVRLSGSTGLTEATLLLLLLLLFLPPALSTASACFAASAEVGRWIRPACTTP